MQKSVFSVIIVVSELLEKRIAKVCQLFQATVVKMPETQAGIEQAIKACQQQLAEQEQLKTSTHHETQRALQQLAGKANDISPLR